MSTEYDVWKTRSPYESGAEWEDKIDAAIEDLGNNCSSDDVHDLIKDWKRDYDLADSEVPEEFVYALNAATQREEGDRIEEASREANKLHRDASARAIQICHEELDMLDTHGPGGAEG